MRPWNAAFGQQKFWLQPQPSNLVSVDGVWGSMTYSKYISHGFATCKRFFSPASEMSPNPSEPSPCLASSMMNGELGGQQVGSRVRLQGRSCCMRGYGVGCSTVLSYWKEAERDNTKYGAQPYKPWLAVGSSAPGWLIPRATAVDNIISIIIISRSV